MSVPPRPAIRTPGAGRFFFPDCSCCFCYRCCVVLAVIAAMLAVLIWWLFPDTSPPISSDFKMQTFTLTSDQLSLTGQVDLTVTNRNRYEVQVRSTELHALYKGFTLTNATLSSTRFPAQHMTTASIPIQASLTQDTAAALIRDMFETCRQGGNGRLQLRVKGKIPVSTWFLTTWIEVPVDQTQSIACPASVPP